MTLNKNLDLPHQTHLRSRDAEDGSWLTSLSHLPSNLAWCWRRILTHPIKHIYPRIMPKKDLDSPHQTHLPSRDAEEGSWLTSSNTCTLAGCWRRILTYLIKHIYSRVMLKKDLDSPHQTSLPSRDTEEESGLTFSNASTFAWCWRRILTYLIKHIYPCVMLK